MYIEIYKVLNNYICNIINYNIVLNSLFKMFKLYI